MSRALELLVPSCSRWPRCCSARPLPPSRRRSTSARTQGRSCSSTSGFLVRPLRGVLPLDGGDAGQARGGRAGGRGRRSRQTRRRARSSWPGTPPDSSTCRILRAPSRRRWESRSCPPRSCSTGGAAGVRARRFPLRARGRVRAPPGRASPGEVEGSASILPQGGRGLRPWRRWILPSRNMRLDAAPLDLALDDHIYFSKRAAAAGGLRRRRLRVQLTGPGAAGPARSPPPWLRPRAPCSGPSLGPWRRTVRSPGRSTPRFSITTKANGSRTSAPTSSSAGRSRAAVRSS
jgi:hypothetical protein